MEYVLRLAPQDINILSAALGEMPFKAVAPLVAKIDAQLQSQTQKEKEEKNNG